MAELRPLFVPPDPVQRTEYRPGELAQWDLWFPPVEIPFGFDQLGRPAGDRGGGGLFAMVGRADDPVSARRTTSSAAICAVSSSWVRCPARVCMTTSRRSRHATAVAAKPTEAFDRFRGALGMGAIFCKPGDPEAKGLVERANRYLETSFLPGRAFTSSHDFNAQLRRLARARQRTDPSHVAVHAGRPDRRRPASDDAVAAAAARRRRGGSRPGCHATTTCGSGRATTRCRPGRSAGGSRCASTSTR